jgi:hypothetical protein
MRAEVGATFAQAPAAVAAAWAFRTVLHRGAARFLQLCEFSGRRPLRGRSFIEALAAGVSRIRSPRCMNAHPWLR